MTYNHQIHFGDGTLKAVHHGTNRWYHITIGGYSTVKYLGRSIFHKNMKTNVKFNKIINYQGNSPLI